MTGARVLVLADDLIWSSRLASQLGLIGAQAVTIRDATAFEGALPGAEAAIVDLTARAYDGVAAIATAARARVPVLAVAQHDDTALRRRALDAGAQRVYAYRKLFEDGPGTLERWLGSSATPTAQ